jgi:hypothetical protein
MEEVDLGVCRAFVFPGTGRGTALILPGAGYSIQAPLLWFARLVLSSAGRTVIAVDDRYSGGEDPSDWVHARARTALARAEDERPIIVAKSISTLAAPLAAERHLPAIWLTPLLHLDPSPVVAGLRAGTAPALAVGGTADPSWNGELARSLGGTEVLEIPNADHSLQVEGDPRRSLDALGSVVAAIQRFVEKVAQASARSSVRPQDST